jgi:sugar lactone lactonase YvrE
MIGALARFVGRLLGVGLLLLAILALALKIRYGGGHTDFPDRSGHGGMPESALEMVAELPTPPGNIAVAPDGRVFITLHPEARPELKVVELVDGEMQPFPDEDFQFQERNPKAFENVLSIRIDRQNRLWALDNGHHGLHPGRLLAFDLKSRALVHEFTFPREIAGLGSHLNDFQVAPNGSHVYIADSSFFAKTPALIVYDVSGRYARRLLEGHESVRPEFFTPVVQGRKMELFGLVSVRPGVDSIALSRDGNWLVYAAITSRKLYTIQTSALRNEQLSPIQLAERVSTLAQSKPMSDGMTTDDRNNVYFSDLEHSAIVLLRPDHRLYTLVKSERLLRWPDGFSFGPDGWLYITCSSLQDVLGRTPGHVRDHAPYRVLRIKPGPSATPGH